MTAQLIQRELIGEPAQIILDQHELGRRDRKQSSVYKIFTQ